jgi:hypothetical protein
MSGPEGRAPGRAEAEDRAVECRRASWAGSAIAVRARSVRSGDIAGRGVLAAADGAVADGGMADGSGRAGVRDALPSRENPPATIMGTVSTVVTSAAR